MSLKIQIKFHFDLKEHNLVYLVFNEPSAVVTEPGIVLSTMSNVSLLCGGRA